MVTEAQVLEIRRKLDEQLFQAHAFLGAFNFIKAVMESIENENEDLTRWQRLTEGRKRQMGVRYLRRVWHRINDHIQALVPAIESLQFDIERQIRSLK